MRPCELFDYKERYFTKILIMNILTICLVLLLLISLFIFKYKSYYQTKAIVSYIDNEYYLQLIMPTEKVDNIISNKILVIDKQKYSYKINSISEELKIDNNFQNYQIIYIKINIEEKKKINNYVLNVRILENDKAIIYYLADYLK